MQELPKPQTSKTRLRVARAKELMVKGFTRSEIIDKLREEFSICWRSANTTMKMMDRVLIAESSNRRSVHLCRQIAKLQHVVRVALRGKQHFASEGRVVESKPDPNVQAAIAAIREQNRLLGLHLPDLDDGEEWAALPMVFQRIQPPTTTEAPDSIPAQANGHANGSPYSRANGSS